MRNFVRTIHASLFLAALASWSAAQESQPEPNGEEGQSTGVKETAPVPDSSPATATAGGPPKVAKRREPIAQDARAIQFSFATAPWEHVLQWFSELCGLSLQMDVKPSGTFNYINDPSQYTLGEALDVLNAQLVPKGFTLIRKGNYLKVIALEEGIPPDLISRISLDELDQRGES